MRSLLLLTFLFLVLTGCNISTQEKKSQFSTPKTPSYIPTISYLAIPGGDAVATNSRILMTFVLDVNDSTLTTYADMNHSGTHSVDLSSTYVETNTSYTYSEDINISYVNKVLTITPLNELDPDTNYTITLRSSIAYLDGTHLDENYTYDFTTASQGDITAPAVQKQYPAENEQNVSIFSSIALEFDEEIVAGSGTVSVDNNASLSFKTKGNNLFIEFDRSLEYNTTYTVNISNVYDLAATPNVFNATFTFTTQAPPQKRSDYFGTNINGAMIATDQNLYLLRYETNSTLGLTSLYIQNDDSLIFDKNISMPVGTTISTWPHYYSHELYIPFSDTIYSYSPYDYNSSFVQADQNFTLKEGSIKNFYMNEDLACFVYDSGVVESYGYSWLTSKVFQPNFKSALFTRPQECLIKDSTLFVLSEDNSSNAIHLLDPISGAEISAFGEAGISSIQAQNTLFAYAINTQIKLYDLSNQALPQLRSTIDINRSIEKIILNEDYLYAIETRDTSPYVYIFDIVDPTQPRLHHTLKADYNITDVAIMNGSLITSNSSGVGAAATLFDISTLAFVNSQAVPLTGTPNSVQTYGYDYVVSHGTGVSVLDRYGNIIQTQSTTGDAVNTASFTNVDTNITYMAVADSDAGVSIYQVDFDALGELNNTTWVSNIINIGRVFDVAAYSMYDATLGHSVTKLLIASATQGLYDYDLSTPATPTLVNTLTQVNGSAIGALYSIELDLQSSTRRMYLADLSGRAIYVYTFNDAATYTYATTISTLPHYPRDLTVDPISHHLFAAMGGAGVLAVDTNNAYTTLLRPTPGFAMQVATATENNSTLFDVFVADQSGISLFTYDDPAGVLQNFALKAFIPQRSASIYGIGVLKDPQTYEIRGALSVSHTNVDSRLYGNYSLPQSLQEYNSNAPIYYIDVSELNVTAVPTYPDMIIPF